MKTNFFKFRYLFILMAVVALSFTACNEDETVSPPLKDKLVGTWDVTSYKLSGDEYMGFIFESASLQFDAYTGEEGQFIQEVTFPDEESTAISGDYTFLEEDDKVVMEYDGDLIFARITITDEDHLEWNGVQDGFPLVMIATRR